VAHVDGAERPDAQGADDRPLGGADGNAVATLGSDELTLLERTNRDVAIDVIERFIRNETGVYADAPGVLLAAVREQATELTRRLAAANLLRLSSTSASRLSELSLKDALRRAALEQCAKGWGFESWRAYAGEDLESGAASSRVVFDIVTTAVRGLLPLVKEQLGILETENDDLRGELDDARRALNQV